MIKYQARKKITRPETRFDLAELSIQFIPLRPVAAYFPPSLFPLFLPFRFAPDVGRFRRPRVISEIDYT